MIDRQAVLAVGEGVEAAPRVAGEPLEKAAVVGGKARAVRRVPTAGQPFRRACTDGRAATLAAERVLPGLLLRRHDRVVFPDRRVASDPGRRFERAGGERLGSRRAPADSLARQHATTAASSESHRCSPRRPRPCVRTSFCQKRQDARLRTQAPAWDAPLDAHRGCPPIPLWVAFALESSGHARLPGGLRLGHGDRRPPGRGRQLEQRLVGVGARARHALSRAERRRVRPLPSLPRRPRSARRPRVQRLSLLARVEPHRARGRRVLDARRSTTTGACATRASSAASRRSSPSTTSRRRAGWRRAAAGPAPATAELFARFCARAQRGTWATSSAASCTLNEPNIVADVGHRWGLFPPGERDPALRAARQRGVDRGPSPGGRARSGAGRAGRRSVSRSRCRTIRRSTAARRLRDRERRDMEDVFLAAARGDDFVGVQTYTPDARSARTACAGRGPARASPRWDGSSGPRRSRRRIRRARALAERADPGHRERRRDRRRPRAHRVRRARAAAACSRASPTGSPVRGLRLLEPARQLRMGVRLRAARSA